MDEEKKPIDWSKYVEEEVEAKDLFKNIKNDKINREFLCNYIDQPIVLWGYFDRIVDKTKALMQNCAFEENGIIISLGHMRWNNFIQHRPANKKYEYGEYVRILGKVDQYNNSDPSYDPEYTYRVDVLQIL